MKKLIAIVVCALAIGASADDSYLLWMVGSDAAFTDASGASIDKPSYTYAAVGVWDSATKTTSYLNLYGKNGSNLETTFAKVGSEFYASLANYTSSSTVSFYIELFNDKGAFVGRTTDDAMLKYADAMAYATTFGIAPPAASAWAPSSFTTAAAPEPSSALLLLLGCAGLALKRKRQAMA